MLERFVPMREWLTPPELVEIETAAPEPQAQPRIENPVVDEFAFEEADGAIDDAKRFRAALADAVETCANDLLRDIAGDVLARELFLAPCDLRAIVSRAMARHGSDLVRIRVRSEDAPGLKDTGLPVCMDDSLRSGDVTLETHYGSIDASLGARLNHVLEQWSV
jgi:flagellar biosynthesis/type III secretory pathway protein FliH